MSNSITLHNTLGINPRLLICSRCGESNGILLLGKNNTVITCNACDMHFYGYPSIDCMLQEHKKCVCGKSNAYDFSMRELASTEHVTSGVCEDCEKELKKINEWVKEGGLLWKCDKCGKSGALRATEHIKNIKAAQVANGTIKDMSSPLGVIFDDCSQHAVEEVDKDTEES